MVYASPGVGRSVNDAADLLVALPTGAVPGGGPAVTRCDFEVRAGDIEPDTGSSRCELAGPIFKEGQEIYVHDPSGRANQTPTPQVQEGLPKARIYHSK
jgi:hypothetical protein